MENEFRERGHALEDDSLLKTDITFESQHGGSSTQVKAFLATPKDEAQRGSVIVVHEIFGLTEHIKEVACRLAQAGYNGLAINFFTREGDPPKVQGDFTPLRNFVGNIPDSQLFDDGKAAMDYLRSRPDSNQKVGMVGFCWGGRVSMLFNAAAPDLNAAVAYYGRISGEKTANQPAYPIDVVAQMHAPLLGHFGEEDTSIPAAETEKLKFSLSACHKPGEVYVYENAGHAFNNDARESYRPDAAKLAWTRTLDWFAHNLQ